MEEGKKVEKKKGGGKHVKEKKEERRKVGTRAPNYSGYTLFTEEFHEEKEKKNKEKHSKKGKGNKRDVLNTFKEVNLEVSDYWNMLIDEKRAEYSKWAEQKRGPGKGKKYVVPFHTRCAPKQFVTVCNNLRVRPDVMKRLKAIWFDKLVDICYQQINRDLCAEFICFFDPPTKQVSIRGICRGIGPADVKELLGLPHCGHDVVIKVEDSNSVFKDLRSAYLNVPYQKIGELLVGPIDENFEFLFILFALGILLSPSASIYVSDWVLKLLTITHHALGGFDWCSFVFQDLCDSIGGFKRELLKGDGRGRKTVGGCIYFLMAICVINRHSPGWQALCLTTMIKYGESQVMSMTMNPVFRSDSFGYYLPEQSYSYSVMEKRQLFLRSYQFCRKKSVAERIRGSLARAKKAVWRRLRSALGLRKVAFSRFKCGFYYRRRRFFRLFNGHSYRRSDSCFF